MTIVESMLNPTATSRAGARGIWQFMYNTGKAYGLTIEIQMSLPSKVYEANQIMSQTPAPDTIVKPGQIIKVSVSRGESSSSVPDLMTKTLASARYLIESAGYTVGTVSYEYSEEIAEGLVIAQNPSADFQLAAGKPVNLTISMGEEPAPDTVPDLLGKTAEEAAVIATDKGFELNVQYSSPVGTSYQDGQIVSQSPAAGQPLKGEGEDPLVVTVFVYKAKEEEQGGEDDEQGSQLKTVSLDIDLSSAVEDSFTMQVTVSHDLDTGSTTSYEVSKSEAVRNISVSGRGTNGSVLVRFNGQMAYRFAVNFESGAYTVTAYELEAPVVETPTETTDSAIEEESTSSGAVSEGGESSDESSESSASTESDGSSGSESSSEEASSSEESGT